MKTEKFLRACKILDEISIPYTVHGGQYITVDRVDHEEVENQFNSECISDNDPCQILIAPDGFLDENDMYEALSYCGLYDGQ